MGSPTRAEHTSPVLLALADHDQRVSVTLDDKTMRANHAERFHLTCICKNFGKEFQ